MQEKSKVLALGRKSPLHQDTPKAAPPGKTWRTSRAEPAACPRSKASSLPGHTRQNGAGRPREVSLPPGSGLRGHTAVLRPALRSQHRGGTDILEPSTGPQTTNVPEHLTYWGGCSARRRGSSGGCHPRVPISAGRVQRGRSQAPARGAQCQDRRQWAQNDMQKAPPEHRLFWWWW